LKALLAEADYTTVYLFLENILSGSMQGRKKIAARLGAETLVPIEELLNAALQFEERGGGGLQSFLDWFERGDTEIKREGLASANEVRVMTVHGSKGLQAPVVILADVTADPNGNKNRDYTLPIGRGLKLPILQINKADRHGMLCDIAETQGAADLNEHFRLLYVAMTRAQERLVMAGALGARAKEGQAPQDSWHTLLAQAMASLGCHEAEDPRWDGVMRHERGARALLSKPPGDLKKTAEPDIAPILPEWILEPAPQEKNPPRPLAPSRLDDDDYGEAPVSAAMERAAQKGRLIHALFERISGGDNAASLTRAAAWLAVQNPGDANSNEAILADIRAVLDNPEWADFFGPDARAEVPLAAVVGTSVITGRVDRLYVGPDHIRLLDFKTGRNVPSDASALPRAYLRQMAHYVAALETIFPGKPVEACLLFTHSALLMTLPSELLTPHRPGI
ncbi:MAG: PD-(D/E)XK nuclease family protein, partial [Sphingorhabdus sp.]|nr:PD-(D/E)XK nuclease family protein [Sphingorhabdus sp.]